MAAFDSFDPRDGKEQPPFARPGEDSIFDVPSAWQEIAALPMASPDTIELARRIAEAQDGNAA